MDKAQPNNGSGPGDIEILKQRAKILAKRIEVEARAETGEPYLVFDISNEKYAIKAEYVAETIPVQRITPVPGVPAHVAGILYNRGEIKSVIDLRALFGLTPLLPEKINLAILIAGPEIDFCIAAQEIFGMRMFTEKEIKDNILSANDAGYSYILGIAPGPVAVLDHNALLNKQSMVIDQ